ncbi:hypothetical protein Rs2_46808 [Raphanus sativus]|nr:hypothetical protein Rs2_46808 [Raphanus sativus]
MEDQNQHFRKRLTVIPVPLPFCRLLAAILLPAPRLSRSGRAALTPALHRFDKGGRLALISCVAWSLYGDGPVIIRRSVCCISRWFAGCFRERYRWFDGYSPLKKAKGWNRLVFGSTT